MYQIHNERIDHVHRTQMLTAHAYIAEKSCCTMVNKSCLEYAIAFNSVWGSMLI